MTDFDEVIYEDDEADQQVADTLFHQYYRIGQVAYLLNCHEKTVRRWVQEGRLKETRIGSTVRFSPDEVTRLIRAHQRNQKL